MPIKKGSLVGLFGDVILDNYIRKFKDESIILATRSSVGGVVIFTSDLLTQTYGFTRADLMQKSSYCHFLFGPETDTKMRNKFRAAVTAKEPTNFPIMLYSKTGCKIPSVVQVLPICPRLHHGEMVLICFSTKYIQGTESEGSIKGCKSLVVHKILESSMKQLPVQEQIVTHPSKTSRTDTAANYRKTKVRLGSEEEFSSNISTVSPSQTDTSYARDHCSRTFKGISESRSVLYDANERSPLLPKHHAISNQADNLVIKNHAAMTDSPDKISPMPLAPLVRLLEDEELQFDVIDDSSSPQGERRNMASASHSNLLHPDPRTRATSLDSGLLLSVSGKDPSINLSRSALNHSSHATPTYRLYNPSKKIRRRMSEFETTASSGFARSSSMLDVSVPAIFGSAPDLNNANRRRNAHVFLDNTIPIDFRPRVFSTTQSGSLAAADKGSIMQNGKNPEKGKFKIGDKIAGVSRQNSTIMCQ